MEPALTGHVVVAAVDGFIQHVRVITTETDNLLLQPGARSNHQIFVALIPQFISMSQRVQYSRTGRLNDMLTHLLSVKWR